MSIDTSADLGVEVPPEVAELAAEEGVEEYLPGVLEMVRLLFPIARQFCLLVEHDPEIANDRHIVIEVEVARADAARANEARWESCRQIFSCCPAPLVTIFRVALRVVE